MNRQEAVLEYVPGPVERLGRRWKMEYVGMASVYAVVGFLIFRPLAPWYMALAGVGAIHFLFLGLKKKTRDHLMASVLLFSAALLARQPILLADWVLPLLYFGATVCAMEAYVEKHQEQIFALPLLAVVWARTDPLWWAGLLFAAAYLAHPWAEKPGLRKRFAWILGASAAAGAAAWMTLPERAPGLVSLLPAERIPFGGALLVGYGVAVALSLACLGAYWGQLIRPHRLNPLIFGALAAFDVRFLAMFGMVTAVALAATVLRRSIDSDTWRPFFKHAEWHFFWWVLALAIWSIATY